MCRIILLVLAGLLAGCTDRLAERQAELNGFVGRPETELLARMGVPDRTYEADGLKYLAYTEHRVDIVPSLAQPVGPPAWVWVQPPPRAVTLTCDTTFTIAAGVVRAFSLRGNACG